MLPSGDMACVHILEYLPGRTLKDEAEEVYGITEDWDSDGGGEPFDPDPQLEALVIHSSYSMAVLKF
jgi:hypothetical protein